jgi:PadR family transcriptional regulator PadR
MSAKAFDREVKKGSAEMLVLALLEERQRHGYEIAKLIETRSDAAITFQAASLYPILYRLEKRGLIEGRWVEKAGERRRRFYRITAPGREVLRRQRSFWKEFIRALDRVAAITHP